MLAVNPSTQPVSQGPRSETSLFSNGGEVSSGQKHGEPVMPHTCESADAVQLNASNAGALLSQDSDQFECTETVIAEPVSASLPTPKGTSKTPNNPTALQSSLEPGVTASDHKLWTDTRNDETSSSSEDSADEEWEMAADSFVSSRQKDVTVCLESEDAGLATRAKDKDSSSKAASSLSKGPPPTAPPRLFYYKEEADSWVATCETAADLEALLYASPPISEADDDSLNGTGIAFSLLSGTQAGWSKNDVATAVWNWFSALSVRDKSQVIAIEDHIWIRLYYILCRKSKTKGKKYPHGRRFERQWLVDRHEKLMRTGESTNSKAGTTFSQNASKEGDISSKTSTRKNKTNNQQGEPNAVDSASCKVEDVCLNASKVSEVSSEQHSAEEDEVLNRSGNSKERPSDETNQTPLSENESSALCAPDIQPDQEVLPTMSREQHSAEEAEVFSKSHKTEELPRDETNKTPLADKGSSAVCVPNIQPDQEALPTMSPEQPLARAFVSDVFSQTMKQVNESLILQGTELSEPNVVTETEVSASELEEIQAAIITEAGSMLQDNVRICSPGSTMASLTLTSEILSNPIKLQASLRQCTEGAFLSGPLHEATARHLGLLGLAYSGASIQIIGGAGISGGTKTYSSTVGLLDTLWMADRYPITVNDFLVSRLELSLWAGYWRHCHCNLSVSDLGVQPYSIPGLQAKAIELQKFWLSLTYLEQIALVEGVPPAQVLVAEAWKSGSHKEIAEEVVTGLLMAPVGWVRRDDGAAVRIAAQKLQSAAADRVAQELLDDLELDEAGQGRNAKAKAKRNERKKKIKEKIKEKKRINTPAPETASKTLKGKDKAVKKPHIETVELSVPELPKETVFKGELERTDIVMDHFNKSTMTIIIDSKPLDHEVTDAKEEDDDEAWEQVPCSRNKHLGSTKKQVSKTQSKNMWGSTAAPQQRKLAPSSSTTQRPEETSKRRPSLKQAGHSMQQQKEPEKISPMRPTLLGKQEKIEPAPLVVAQPPILLQSEGSSPPVPPASRNEDVEPKQEEITNTPAHPIKSKIENCPITPPTLATSKSENCPVTEFPIAPPALATSATSSEDRERGEKTKIKTKKVREEYKRRKMIKELLAEVLLPAVEHAIDKRAKAIKDQKLASPVKQECSAPKQTCTSSKEIDDSLKVEPHSPEQPASIPISSEEKVAWNVPGQFLASFYKSHTPTVYNSQAWRSGSFEQDPKPVPGQAGQACSASTSVNHCFNIPPRLQGKNGFPASTPHGFPETQGNAAPKFSGDLRRGYRFQHSDHWKGKHRNSSYEAPFHKSSFSNGRRDTFSGHRERRHSGGFSAEASDWPAVSKETTSETQSEKEVYTTYPRNQNFRNDRGKYPYRHRTNSYSDRHWPSTSRYRNNYFDKDTSHHSQKERSTVGSTEEPSDNHSTGKASHNGAESGDDESKASGDCNYDSAAVDQYGWPAQMSEDEFQAMLLQCAENQNVMIERLNENIQDFLSKLKRVMAPRIKARECVIEETRRLIKELWADANVEVYGSCFTGLEIPSSDVDLVICNISGPTQSPSNYVALEVVWLQQLAILLKEQKWIFGMKVIETAQIPVIKLLADPSILNGENANPVEEGVAEVWFGGGGQQKYVPLDISFDGPVHGGVSSSVYVKEACAQGRYPEIAPLSLILKELLMQRGLNQPTSGGLSSYSLALLLMTVLKRRKERLKKKDEPENNESNLGEVLIEFLEFYGRQFDPAHYGVEILEGDDYVDPLFKLEHKIEPRTGMPAAEHLLIKDPMGSFKNTAKACYGFAQIQWQLSQCLTVLELQGSLLAASDPTANVLHLLLYY